ncbi:MAG: MYG1 family protein [Candidatus Kaiserbacteria bacterium]|nr:MYG1 family protein [Candidatus Kaiserbacteria bacterium]MCB9816754.1 MYG1 family protein [Candidatus Nomurabacteria bacterium]
MQTVVTHDGSFHPDDVLAVATIKILLAEEPIKIIRTRERDEIDKADWVVDVGDRFDPATQRFDHHQNGIPARENGIPYAAFGLVWREYGEQICGSKEISDQIDAQIVQPVDAGDNGIALYELNDRGVAPYELFSVLSAFRPVWGSEHENDAAFAEAVEFAKQLLMRIIAHAQASEAVRQVAESGYQAAEDKELLVFEDPIDRHMFIQYPDVRMVVYPSDTTKKKWKASTIPTGEVVFESRVDFPKEWGGLRDGALAEVTGIEDAVFCHKNVFLFVAASKESAIKAAKIALGREV